MTDFEFKVNKRIKELVDKSGLTQREIANMANINCTKLSKIMNPEKYTTTATAEDITNLAMILNVSTDYLLTGAEYTEREEQDLLKLMDEHDARTAIKSLARFMIMCPYSFYLTEGKTESSYRGGDLKEPITWETNTLSLTVADGSVFLNEEELSPEAELLPTHYRDYSYMVWYGLLSQIDKVRMLGSFTPSQQMKMAEVIIDDHLTNNHMEKALDEEGNLIREAGLPNW